MFVDILKVHIVRASGLTEVKGDGGHLNSDMEINPGSVLPF